MPDLWEVRKQKAEERKKRLKEYADQVTTDRIAYITNVILKEVRKEHRLVMQLLYALFSIYTPNPVNLAINAPTGEGKTYGLKYVAGVFPDDDMEHLGGMSEKALFHRKGEVVVKEDDNEYAPIEKYTDEIHAELEEIAEDLKDADNKSELRARRRELEEKLARYESEAIKRIDLRQKALIFQDTPDAKLLETIMPLLSHDQPRVFYEFASKNNNGIQTISNMIEGWPSVIYCQAIDTSARERWPELLRRFIICNPEMTREKYAEAIDQVYKGSYTDNKYELEVVTKEEKETAKGIVLDIIDTLKEHFADNPRNAVVMPFRESVKSSFKTEGAFDVGVAKKTHDLLVLISVVNLKERPYLLTQDGRRIPFCTFKDLEESLYINEFVFGGLRQYVLQWYISVFYHEWNKKNLNNDLDAVQKNNHEVIMESKPVARLGELARRTQEVYGGEKLADNELKKKYLYPLVNHGYIDELQSEVKTKEKVYYPTSHEIVHRYEVKDNKLKLIKKLQVRDPTAYPSKRYLAEQIAEDMKVELGSKLCDFDGTEISISDLIEKYYPMPEIHFEEYHDKTGEDLEKLTGINTPVTQRMDVFTKEKNIPKLVACSKCGKSFLEDQMKDHLDLDNCEPRKKSFF